MNRTCACGHVEDEHDSSVPSRPCTVEACDCFAGDFVDDWDPEDN